MINPCPRKIDCPPADPGTNYSSEDFELSEWFGVAYSFGADGCVARCTSNISQEDANLCAQRQLVLCQNAANPDFTAIENEEQECTVSCPDGTTYTYVVPAGTFIAATLEEANAQAAAYACQQAPLNLLCMGPVSRCCCQGSAFSEESPCSGDARALTFEVFSGALPDGLELTGGEMLFTLAGTPTAAGNYTFGIRATDAQGSHADAIYSLSVIAIADSSLPAFEVGSAYSHQLTASGGSGNYAWRVKSGSLPPGLTLSLDGLISGTPTGGATGNITFECADQTCEAINETFYPPRIALVTASVTRIATVKGYPEFPGFISSPPKRYKKITWSGTSEQSATWLGDLDGVSYNGVNCARAKYEWSGSGEINNQGEQITNYVKNFFQACPTATQWPRNIAIPRLGLNVLKGYCWPTDPNSCPTCANPPVFSEDVSANSISDFSDFMGGSSMPASDATHAANVSTAGGLILLEGAVNAPSTDLNDIEGAWALCQASHNFSVALEDEYTDAIALANAFTFASNSNTAETTLRTTGLVSRFTSVLYSLQCTNLFVGESYTVTVELYNTKTGARATRAYAFTADAETHHIEDTIPTPNDGQPIQVRNPRIAYST